MARRKATPRRRAPRRAARRPIKRRATARKQPATSVKKQSGGGSAAAHHQVRMHPFSKATQQPKIPDGELTTSLSRRLQAVYQLTNGNGTLGQDYMDVVFAPTLGVPLVASGSTEGVTVRNASANQASYHGFTGQTVGLDLQNPTGSAPQSIPSTGPGSRSYEIHNQCGFAKWRIVSQGVRFDLTNTDEENDGWWEACRFNWRRLNSDLCITPLDGSKTGTLLGVAPSHQVAMHLRTISMPEQSGYETGLIKDIKKHEFMLHPQSGTHDPVELDKQYNIVETQSFNVDTNAQQLSLIDGNVTAGRIKDTTVDSNMDWMYIRFHPRTNSGAGSANGSSLLTSMIQNIEVAFNPSSDFATFQTINKLDGKHKKVTDATNNNSKASKKRGHDYEQETSVIEYEPMEIDGTPSGSITKTDPDYLQLRAKKIRDANHSLGRLSNSGIWKKHFHDNKLAVFQGQALDSAGGYRIRNSDHTGETELYITDRPSGRIRQGDSKSKYLAIQNGPEKMEDLIVKHDVDTVYASHGGEDILAMMDIDPDVKQIVVATPPKKKSKVSTLAKNRRPRMKVKPKNSTELYLDSVGGLDGVQLTNKIAYNPNDSFITKFKKGVRNGEQWIYNWLPPETKQKFFPSGNPMLRKNDPDRIAAGIILMEDKEARKKAAEGAAQMFEAYFGGKVAAEQYQVGGAAAALPAITGTGTAMALTNQAFNQDEFEDHYNSTALVPYEGEGGSTIMAPYIP